MSHAANDQGRSGAGDETAGRDVTSNGQGITWYQAAESLAPRRFG
jgi:hypothetical protein